MNAVVHTAVARVRANVALVVLVPLVLLAGILSAAFVLHLKVSWLASDRWDIAVEGSWAEWCGHVVEAAIVVGLLLLHRRRRDAHLLVWAATFLYIGVDDTFQLHEHAGAVLVRLLGGHDNQFGVRHQDLGELASWAIAGALFGWLLVRTWRRATPETKADGLQLAVGLVVLVFCGMVLDTVDRVIDPEWHQLLRASVVAEDGGELVALAFLAASVAGFWRRATSEAPVAVPPTVFPVEAVPSPGQMSPI